MIICNLTIKEDLKNFPTLYFNYKQLNFTFTFPLDIAFAKKSSNFIIYNTPQIILILIYNICSFTSSDLVIQCLKGYLYFN